MPFFSIVIPTYNRASFIETTISTLLNQRFDDFEIVVVDDGSTDDTELRIRAIKNPKLRYYKKENGERGAARNFGAQKSTGQYINFFDSDDVAYPNHLEIAHAACREKNPEVFHTLYDIKRNNIVQPADHVFDSATVNQGLIVENFLSCNNVFIRKDIALKHPFPEDRRMAVAEDWALWLQLASRYPFHHINELSSTIIFHDNRSVFDFNIDKIIQRDLLLIDYLLNDKSFISYYANKVAGFVADRYTFIALFLAIKSRKKESITYLFKSVKKDFSVLFRRRFWGTIKTLLLK